MFQDRSEAGRELAVKLRKYSGVAGVILAVPRGGVPVAYEVAKETGMPLDLLFTKKIGHPQNREYAIGAVSLTDAYVLPNAGISAGYIKAETERIRARLGEMQVKFNGTEHLQSLKDKVVIIVDDGIATGNTLLISLNMIRKEGPSRIVVAVPVAARSAAVKLGKAVDEMVCVLIPERFEGVGGFYEDFHQVTDEEVAYYLDKLRKSVAVMNETKNTRL
ncbi:MAG: phosphoribosyltransferase [Bacteroidetes bacterium]|nr:phosphoribosyltransferase [Bacteroidota bacterium]